MIWWSTIWSSNDTDDGFPQQVLFVVVQWQLVGELPEYRHDQLPQPCVLSLSQRTMFPVLSADIFNGFNVFFAPQNLGIDIKIIKFELTVT